MKRFFFVPIIFVLVCTSGLRGQDAATEERLNKLNGHIEDLLAAQATLQKRISVLAKEIDSVREQSSKPSTENYASHEDVKRLAEKLQEVDRKREADKELILKEIERLGKMPAIAATPKKAKDSAPVPATPKGDSRAPATPDKGFDYVIQSGDTLSVIAQDVSRQKGIKVTPEQIVKANPGLEERKLRVGQKIFIPMPQ
jgi:LysM repeat protein